MGLNDPLPCALLYLYFFGKLFIHFCFCFKGFWVDPHFKDQHKVLIRFFSAEILLKPLILKFLLTKFQFPKSIIRNMRELKHVRRLQLK